MPLQPLFDPRSLPHLPDPEGLGRDDVLGLLEEHEVRFLRLQFTDILGQVKGIEVPTSQFEKALDGEIAFDGSVIEGFVRVEESDLLLRPDLSTLRIFPWGDASTRVARLTCDVHRPNGAPFEGDPRGALRRVLQELEAEGLHAAVGVETEFFLFERTPEGAPTTTTRDRGGYLDVNPVARADLARRDIVGVLEAMGLEVESAHHDVAPGQHAIDFRYADALATADRLVTLKLVVRTVAEWHGLHAAFMPKPIFGRPGCGMHTHVSLWREGGNAFHDPEQPDQLSELLRFYVGGLLRHARGLCAVTNPLVNSYKRLVPGMEAPVHVAWSLQNRSSLVRIPAQRAAGTRCEVRLPDPAANPYLAIAVQLAAGLAGIREEVEPGLPVNKNIWTMTQRELQRRKIEELPRNLGEALDALERDRVVRSALGEHIYSHFTQAKRAEFDEYLAQVHSWELERYLDY